MSSRRVIRGIVASKLHEYGIPKFFAEDIIRYIDLLVDHINVSGVILYGSVAYGRPDINSDIDVIVVSPDFDKPTDKIFQLRRAISAKRPSRISSIWLGEKEIIRVFKGFSGFLLDALYYGVILYDEKGILRKLKERLELAIRMGYIERRLGMWRITTKGWICTIMI